MRRLSEISDQLVTVGDRWWGKLYWIQGGTRGAEVRQFRDLALLKGYADLLEEGFVWGHRDPLAWHVLVLDPAEEVGEDFVIVKRFAGTQIRDFYPAHTDDPVEPPTEQLALLGETVARMCVEAESPRDKFLAELVARRLAAVDYHLVFDWSEDENRFHLWDPDPDHEELTTWIATARKAYGVT